MDCNKLRYVMLRVKQDQTSLETTWTYLVLLGGVFLGLPSNRCSMQHLISITGVPW